MNYPTGSMQNAPIATSAATTSNGAQIQTAKVQNSAQSTSELTIRIENQHATNRITGIELFSGYKKGANLLSKFEDPSGQTKDGKLTAEGFATVQEFVDYFTNRGTIIAGAEIETDNVANLSQRIIQEEKYPDGTTIKAHQTIADYRVALGSSWQNRVKIPAENLTVVISDILTLSLQSLEPASYMEIRFKVAGVNKAHELSPIPTNKI